MFKSSVLACRRFALPNNIISRIDRFSTCSVCTFKPQMLIENTNNQLNYSIPKKHILVYRRPVQFTYVRSMAGHAKWQNVKHIKEAKNKEKSFLCDRYSRLVRAAVKENGPDPKLNNKLALLFDEARKHSVPFSTLESAMKRASSGKMKFGTLEIAGPGGCFVVLDYETDNVSTARYSIKMTLKKYGGVIMQGEGRWRAVYDQKGILKAVGKSDGQPLDAEMALDAAIEAGAEDVQLRTDDENNSYLEFFCGPSDLHSVKKELEKMLYNLEEAYIGYIPRANVELSPEDMQAAYDLFAELQGLPDVVRIFENVQ